jgi:hypothetical protein
MGCLPDRLDLFPGLVGDDDFLSRPNLTVKSSPSANPAHPLARLHDACAHTGQEFSSVGDHDFLRHWWQGINCANFSVHKVPNQPFP